MPYTKLSDIEPKQLKMVDWSGHVVTTAEAAALGEILKTNTSVETLDLSITTLTNDAFNSIIAGISENTALKEIDVSYNELTNDSKVIAIIEKLIREKKISKLNFQYNDYLNIPETIERLDSIKKEVDSKIILVSKLPPGAALKCTFFEDRRNQAAFNEEKTNSPSTKMPRKNSF